MNSNDKDRLFASDSDGPDDEHPPERAPRGAQRERGYTHFDEQDEDYEEPDRDTDCATIFTEEDDEGYYLDEPEPLAEDIFSDGIQAGPRRGRPTDAQRPDAVTGSPQTLRRPAH